MDNAVVNSSQVAYNMTVQYNQVINPQAITTCMLQSTLSFTVVSVTFILLTRSDVTVIVTNGVAVSCTPDDFFVHGLNSACMDSTLTSNTIKTFRCPQTVSSKLQIIQICVTGSKLDAIGKTVSRTSVQY